MFFENFLQIKETLTGCLGMNIINVQKIRKIPKKNLRTVPKGNQPKLCKFFATLAVLKLFHTNRKKLKDFCIEQIFSEISA